MCVYGDDDRWYQNIFAGGAEEINDWKLGTAHYNGCPTSMEEYLCETRGEEEGSNEKGRQPAYINGNCYFGSAEAFDREENKFIGKDAVNAKLVKEEGKVYLEIDVPQDMLQLKTKIICTEHLEPPRVCE